jgi:hypothetical protein
VGRKPGAADKQFSVTGSQFSVRHGSRSRFGCGAFESLDLPGQLLLLGLDHFADTGKMVLRIITGGLSGKRAGPPGEGCGRHAVAGSKSIGSTGGERKGQVLNIGVPRAPASELDGEFRGRLTYCDQEPRRGARWAHPRDSASAAAIRSSLPEMAFLRERRTISGQGKPASAAARWLLM